MRLTAIAVTFLAMVAAGHAEAAGCTAAPQASSEIAGNYIDNYGGLQAVSGRFWVSGGSVFEVCSVDNGARHLIAYNHLGNSDNPGKFSRFEWVKAEGRLWYCQAVFDAATEGSAAQSPTADPAHPSEKGCGTFLWSTLVRILP